MQGRSKGCQQPSSLSVSLFTRVMYRDADGKMWFTRVKQLFQPILHILRHTLKPCMASPVVRRIFGERPFPMIVAGDGIVIEVKQNAQAGLCGEGMSGCHGNVITAGNRVTCFIKAGGCQVFLHGKMRELYDFCGRISNIDNGKQTGACRQHRVYWVFRAQILMIFRNWFGVEIERK